MALWKSERSSLPLFTLSAPSRYLDLATFAAIGAAFALLLTWFIPLPLVLPVLGVASFFIACIAALSAHYAGVDRRTPGMTLWDVAGACTLIWLGAGVIGGSKHVVQLLDRLAAP